MSGLQAALGQVLPAAPPNQALIVATMVVLTLSAAAFICCSDPSSRSRLTARKQAIITRTPNAPTAAGNERRRRQVTDALREIEARQKAKSNRNTKPTLAKRLRQAGLAWSRYTYFVVSACVAAVVYLVAFGIGGLGLVPSAGFAGAAGLLLPHFYVARRGNSRLKAFSADFPNALDVIVRGVQAGLPLTECLKIIAAEAQEPVRSEFKSIQQDQSLGVPLGEAVERMAGRIPLSETNFFSIVIAIQSRSGGNLSEALGNLAKLLRDRKAMRGKIKAMSSEAKTSAGIIGVMPLAVGGMLAFTSPDYIALLFTTSTGQITMAVSAVWMGVGAFIMQKMINFDF